VRILLKRITICFWTGFSRLRVGSSAWLLWSR